MRLCACPWLALSLFAACQSAPPPRLVARDLFDASYAGNISPLAADDAEVFTFEPPAATDQPMQPIAFRATVLDLTIEEARAFVPDLVAPPPPPVEVLDGEAEEPPTREWSDARVVTHSPRGVMATPRLRGIGLAGGHVDPAALRLALTAMTGADVPQRIVADARGVVSIGSETAVTASKQLAFVRGLRLAAITDSFLVDDIDVDTFEYGQQLRIAARQDGDAVRLELKWIEHAPVRPIATSGDAHGRLQVPVLKRHRVTAATNVTAEDSIVVASLPGGEPGRVHVLCLELVATPATPVATR